ncbi:MAG: carbohydrate ABC transporter permease [Oscillospiraceae bacterium]|nr:carbohydrate ABC transporter permease [Oscillospiraceae bacterium]
MKAVKKIEMSSLLLEVLLIIISFFFILPLFWMFMTSFKTAGQITQFKEIIPFPFSLRSYIEGFSSSPFIRYIFNTVRIGILCVIGTLFSCSLVAFGFAKFKAKGKNILFIILLSTMMVPQTVTLIPSYMLYSKLGWINTIIPLVAPAFFAGSAFNIFLLRQFFSSLPNDLAEAAHIDGCSWIQIFYKIYIPNTIPALLVVTINQLVFVWNDYMAPLIYLGKPSGFTIALGLNMLKAEAGGAMDSGPLMAMSSISILPLLILYISFQKYFVEGLATSGLKD